MWANLEAFGTLFKAQIPGSDFKSAELETPRNGAQESIILQSLSVTILKKWLHLMPGQLILN